MLHIYHVTARPGDIRTVAHYGGPNEKVNVVHRLGAIAHIQWRHSGMGANPPGDTFQGDTRVK